MTPTETARTPEILAVIPVSGQDPEFETGLPSLNGRPLLSYTFEAAKASQLVGRSIVWTDDGRIAAAAREAGLEAPRLRDPSERRHTMARVLNDAIACLVEEDEDYRPEWIVRLNVTYPFRAEGFIDQAIRTVLSQDLDSAFVALPEFDTFWHLAPDGIPSRITTDPTVPRSRRTPIYRELGGLFSMVQRSVLDNGLLYGERLGIIPIESPRSAVDLHAIRGFEFASAFADAGVDRKANK